MPWYSITSLMTDKDSPLNQTLFDYIREDLEYLHDQLDGLVINLGGSAGETDGPNTTVVDIGGAFNLPAPASGHKWRLEVKIQGKKTLGTPKLRLILYDKTDAELQHVDSNSLTASYLDYTLTLDVTTAIWGRLVIYYWGTSSQVQSRNGAARAYMVDAP